MNKTAKEDKRVSMREAIATYVVDDARSALKALPVLSRSLPATRLSASAAAILR